MLQRLRNRLYALQNGPVVRSQVIFLISAPRSGTTWLKEALNAHPEVYCTENRFFGDYYDFIQDGDSTRPRLRITLDKYVDSFLKHFNRRHIQANEPGIQDRFQVAIMEAILSVSQGMAGKPILVDKITPYLHTSELVVHSLRRYFPRLKIVHLIRDGRDVLTSGVFHWLKKDQLGGVVGEMTEKRRAIFIYNDPSLRLRRFFSDEDIEEWGQIWVEPLQALSKARKDVDYFRISYERLIQDQGKALEELFRFLGADASGELVQTCVQASSFERMSGGRKRGESSPTAHVRKGVVGDWKNYFTQRDGELFQRLGGRYLRAYGYEKDDSWVKQLPLELDLGC